MKAPYLIGSSLLLPIVIGLPTVQLFLEIVFSQCDVMLEIVEGQVKISRVALSSHLKIDAESWRF